MCSRKNIDYINTCNAVFMKYHGVEDIKKANLYAVSSLRGLNVMNGVMEKDLRLDRVQIEVVDDDMESEKTHPEWNAERLDQEVARRLAHGAVIYPPFPRVISN